MKKIRIFVSERLSHKWKYHSILLLFSQIIEGRGSSIESVSSSHASGPEFDPHVFAQEQFGYMVTGRARNDIKCVEGP